MKYIITIFLALSISSCVTTPTEFTTTIGEEKTILRVEVKSVEYTDYYPADACSEITEPDTECIVWSFYYRYDAKVKEVVKGEYSDKHITFVMLQHAPYIKEITNNWYVSLDTLDNSEIEAKLKAKYYVVDHASRQQENIDELLNGG